MLVVIKFVKVSSKIELQKLVKRFILFIAFISFTSCSASPNVITKEEFELIQEGMSYQEVIDIIGQEYTDVNDEAWGAGIPTIFTWKNQDGSQVSISMSYGARVANKWQKGL